MSGEIEVPRALVRVLREAEIEFVFGMPGGDTGRIFDTLAGSGRDPSLRGQHRGQEPR